jgi:hypothetical protein
VPNWFFRVSLWVEERAGVVIRIALASYISRGQIMLSELGNLMDSLDKFLPADAVLLGRAGQRLTYFSRALLERGIADDGYFAVRLVKAPRASGTGMYLISVEQDDVRDGRWW